MKYTRVEIKSKFKKYRALICFTVLIPIFSLFIGKMLMNYSEKEATSIAVKLNDFENIYFLQLGVYKNEDGAKEKVKFLKENNINAILLKDDDYYKIVYKLASSPKILEEDKNKIEGKNIPVYIKDFSIKGVEDIKDGNIKEYGIYVKEYILSSLDRKRSVMKSSYNSAKKINTLEGNNKSFQDKLNILMENNLKSDMDIENEEYIKNTMEIIMNYNKIV